jgi:hypothetical protein
MPPADAELKLATGSAGASPSRSLALLVKIPALIRSETPQALPGGATLDLFSIRCAASSGLEILVSNRQVAVKFGHI